MYPVKDLPVLRAIVWSDEAGQNLQNSQACHNDAKAGMQTQVL